MAVSSASPLQAPNGLVALSYEAGDATVVTLPIVHSLRAPMTVAQLPSEVATIDVGVPAQNRDRTPDARLTRLIQERDAEALELVYDRHADDAFGLALRIVGDRALAEDVAQEAFLCVWRSAHRYRPERGSVRTWVLGITHNRGIDALRRNATQARLRAKEATLAERPPERDLPEAEAQRRDDTRASQVALQTLPGEQRQAIELAYFAGLTHREIAVKLDLPLGTVKGRIRIGLEKLRDALGPVEVGA